MTDPATLQILTEAQLLSFYGWWQFAVCLFAFVALIAIWWHIGRKQQDFGQVWLALSVLCWSFTGGIEVYYADQLQMDTEVVVNSFLPEQSTTPNLHQEVLLEQVQEKHQQRSFQLDGWRSILSLLNSLFILLALPWFRYLPRFIEPVVKSKYWHFIVGLPFLFSLLPTISKMVSGVGSALVSEPDVYYAILTLAFLGSVLWESFDKRRLPMLAWLSVFCIVITLIAQILKWNGSDVDQTLFSAIFKTSLIMIFFALALSWVKELSENVIPTGPENLFFKFHSVEKRVPGGMEHLVHWSGEFPAKGRTGSSPLTPALCMNSCYNFAQRINTKPVTTGWRSNPNPTADRASNTIFGTTMRSGASSTPCSTVFSAKVPGPRNYTSNHCAMPYLRCRKNVSGRSG